MGKKPLKLATKIQDCPCGAVDYNGERLAFNDCCGSLILAQQPAQTAVQLMRSRYTAYTLMILNT